MPSTSVALDRELVRRGGLYAFVKLAWPQVEPARFLDNWHIEEVCKHLEAVTRCELLRLIINVPPGCMKSLLTSVFWPVWTWLQDPSVKWMFASFDASLSRRDALKARRLINSTWFRERWGDRLAVGESKDAADSATEYYAQVGGVPKGLRFSTSVKGRATGWHADIQVVDDPIKPKDTKGGAEATGKELQLAKEWWTSTMSTRTANPETFRRVIIMQRLHEDDLTGVSLAGGEYVHLRLPMEYEHDNPCCTPIGGDRRSGEGDLLWPARYPAAFVERMRSATDGLGPLDYAAQYQQRPVRKGGDTFKDAHFSKRYLALPAGCQFLQSWDMRFIESSTRGDYVVGGVWAYRKAEFYLCKVYRGRWSFTETIEAMRRAAEEWPDATLKLVEDKANGPAIANTLQKELPGIVLVNPEGGKVARANAVSPLFEAGNVWLPHDSLGEPWVADYIAELTAFPRGRNDDQVDMTSQALLRLKASTMHTFLEAWGEVSDVFS